MQKRTHLLFAFLLYPQGLMPLWPIGPKIKGIVRVGGLSEWIVAAGILAAIFALLGVMRI